MDLVTAIVVNIRIIPFILGILVMLTFLFYKD